MKRNKKNIKNYKQLINMADTFKIPKNLNEYHDEQEILNDFWSYNSNRKKIKKSFGLMISLLVFLILWMCGTFITTGILIYTIFYKIDWFLKVMVGGIPFFTFLGFLFFIFIFSNLLFSNTYKNSKVETENRQNPLIDTIAISLLAIGYVNLEYSLLKILNNFHIKVTPIQNQKTFKINKVWKNEKKLSKFLISIMISVFSMAMYSGLQFGINGLLIAVGAR